MLPPLPVPTPVLATVLDALPADLWDQVGLMLLVVALKTVEVLLQTFRTVFVVSGRRAHAGAVALVEASVVISALGIVLSDITPARIIGFVVGVSLGTVVGMEAVFRFRLGVVTVRAFLPPEHAPAAAARIRALGHGATTFTGEGRNGEVAMLLSSVRRRHVPEVTAAITGVHERAFTTVDNAPAPGSAIGGLLGHRV